MLLIPLPPFCEQQEREQRKNQKYFPVNSGGYLAGKYLIDV